MAWAMGLEALAWGSEGDEDAGVAFVEGEDGVSIGPEQHQVGLPVARGEAVIGGLGALGDGATQSHEGGGAVPFAGSPTPLRLGMGQVVAPAVVLLACHLGVDEPVDALMGDDRISRLHSQPTPTPAPVTSLA